MDSGFRQTIELATVQLLRKHGCRVLARDFDAKMLALAARFGAAAFLDSVPRPVSVAYPGLVD
jgi:hypothetical protein